MRSLIYRILTWLAEPFDDRRSELRRVVVPRGATRLVDTTGEDRAVVVVDHGGRETPVFPGGRWEVYGGELGIEFRTLRRTADDGWRATAMSRPGRSHVLSSQGQVPAYCEVVG